MHALLKECCGGRMFIRLVRMQLHWQTTDVFRNVSRHIGVPHFLRSALVISCMNLQKKTRKGGTRYLSSKWCQWRCPIGYFVIKGELVDLGVIYQWEIFFKPGGRSGFEDHTEVEIIKYLGREWFWSFLIFVLTA